MSSSSAKYPKTVANGKFELQKRLGSGCFGDVYKGINTATKEEVAIKVEDQKTEAPQLKNEADVLDALKGNGTNGTSAVQGFTTPYHFYGTEGHWNVLVMPMLSRSLEDCVQICKGRFSVKTALMVADQVLRRIEYLHSKGILHRDIKPENFMWGIKEKQHHCHLIDFGLSKRYHDGKNHIVFKQGRSLTGTARYASLNAHRGYEQGRRDDLEAIGHMLIYFLRGSLPWSGLEAKTKEEKYRKIHQKKESVPLDELCTGYPSCFKEEIRITRDLQFKERPDYNMLRGMFTSEFESQGLTEDYIFDWFVGKKQADYAWAPIGAWTSPMQPDDVADGGPSNGSGGGEGNAEGDEKKKKGLMSFCPCGRASAVKD